MSLDIDLNRLGIFKTVASLGSFSKAASYLKQPKSRISRNIAALEKEVGVALIYRTTRQFQLTAAGQDLFQKVTPHLSALENVIQSVEGTNEAAISGTIRMTVSNDIGIELMAKYAFEFQQTYPLCRIELFVDNKNIDLVGEGVDLALRFGSLRDSSLKLRKLGLLQLRIFMSPILLRQLPELQKISDLEAVPYIAFKKHENRKNSLKVISPKAEVALKLSPIFSSDNFFVNKKMAVLGAGFCVLPGFLTENEVHNGELVSLFKDWGTERIPFNLLMPQQKKAPIRLKLFVEFLEQKLKNIL